MNGMPRIHEPRIRMNKNVILKTLFSIALVFCFAATRVTLADAESLLSQFVGEWRSDGAAFGAPAESFMTWKPTLDGQFIRLDYKIQMTRESGETQVFEGIAFYKSGDGKVIRAFWADNSGDLHPIVADREGNAIVSLWGIEGGKQGRTRYELLTPNTIEVTDWLKTSDGWRQFNNNVFIKLGKRSSETN